jgi:Na+-transporting NADH:ubiquinone oxidoreductase subunit NqrF
MSKVIYGGQSYECGEYSVLDCLTAQGVPVPSSCRSGVCQTCLMRAVKGEVPNKAKEGLKATLAAQNYFMACLCYPKQDIEAVLPDAGMGKLEARVTDVEYLNADILGIRLKPSRPFEYRAGDAVTISEATGDCFYVPGNPGQNILLIATGSGLAPLYGIIRDALLNGHQGKLSLYHGSYNPDGFYLVGELKQLAQTHPNFSYVRCVSESEAPAGYASGMVLDVALGDHPDLSGWRVFLCGNPDMVNAARQQTFFAGASIRDIFADPF